MTLRAPSDLVASTLGSEKVTNGNFSLSASWTFGKDSGNGWTYDGTNDEADCNGSQTVQVDLEQDISAVASERYLLQYKIKNWVAGTVIPQIGGVDGKERSANGVCEDYITATGTGNLKFQALGGGSFVENGTFDDDNDPPDDWTAVTATLTTEGSGQDGNCMQVASSGDNIGKAYQDITTIVGVVYNFSGYFQKGTSSAGRFFIGTTTDEDSLYDSGALTDASWAEHTDTFTATATTTRITCRTDDATDGETSLFDEITVAYSGFNGSIDNVTVKKVLTAGTIRITWTNNSSYSHVSLFHKQGGDEWARLEMLDGTETSYDHESVTSNILHHYKARGRILPRLNGDISDFSNTDSAACWTDNITDEIVISESITDYGTGSECSDTIEETICVSDFVIDAKDIITNYVYYLGTATGGIYEYGGFYKSDAGTAITARWESKDTDFADQSIENSDKFKTVEFVRLHYIDKSAGAHISIKVSTDGGASWTTKTKNIGTGNSKGKTKDFYFVTTGQIFRFAIESISAIDEFQWAGLEVFYNVGGDYFESN